MKKNKERVCKNAKCKRTFSDDSKSKYCPKCRKKHDSDVAKGAAAGVGVLSLFYGVYRLIRRK